MLLAAFLITTASHQAIPKAEAAMLEALKTRNPVAVKRLMNRHIPFFSFFPAPKNSDFYKELPERYIYAWSCIFPNSTEDDIQINLERISKLIATTKPRIVNSIHNDFTAHTIRGTVKPGDDWEIHYSVLKSGRIVIQRICEFNNTPKFRWGREWRDDNMPAAKEYDEKKRPNKLDMTMLKALKTQDSNTFRRCFQSVLLSATKHVDEDSKIDFQVYGFSPNQQETLKWSLLSIGRLSQKNSNQQIWHALKPFSSDLQLKLSPHNDRYAGGIAYTGTTLPSQNSELSQHLGGGTFQYYTLYSRSGKLPLIKKIENADDYLDFGLIWFNVIPLEGNS